MENNIEEIIQKKGGRLFIEDFPNENFVTHYNLIKDVCSRTIYNLSNQYPTIKNIEFDIINNFSFNAFATGGNDSYFIGINRGLIATLCLVFDRFLADRNLFPEIGNPNMEVENLPIIEKIKPFYIDFASGVELFNPPIDPILQMYASDLMMHSLNFILGHELAHIQEGHIGYLNDNNASPFIGELSVNVDKKLLNPLLNKTFEMRADSQAALLLLSNELQKTILKIKNGNSQLAKIYLNPYSIIKRFIIVLPTIFRIFQDQRNENQSFSESNYPNPRLRFLIATYSIGILPEFKKLNKIQKFQFTEANIVDFIFKYCLYIEKVFEKVSGVQFDINTFKSELGVEGVKKLRILTSHHNNHVVKLLEDFKHLPNRQTLY